MNFLDRYKKRLQEWCKNVGEESRKTFLQKLDDGFFSKYMNGNGLDIGGKGYVDAHAILPSATLVDLDYPNYDGITLPFDNNSQDYVYASHTLEHIEDYGNALNEWLRVTKKGGHVIIVVPHKFLYEKKDAPPSRFNEGHLRFYSPASLLKEIEDSLTFGSYRVRHLRDNDERHNYQDPPEVHGRWLYELEIVLEKL